ncbi:acetyltransferase [Clostridium tagluense]|uniref:acetyltransferase n=2 Tax=Clostridium tagluense TaxID=360422 RepID=UPI0035A14C9A
MKVGVIMKNIVICGAGGFGREVAWLIENINKVKKEWNIMGFVDNTPELKEKIINNYPVLGDESWFDGIWYPIYTVCAIGSSKGKRSWVERLSKNKNIQFATLIDPSVNISNVVQIGEGTIICAGTIVTVNIKIGNHVIINLDCTVGHDAVILDYCTINPSVNISGNVYISSMVEVGTGTNIIQGKSIGTNSIIGAGSVVTKNIPDYCTAVGIPAKPIKFHAEQKGVLENCK